MPLPQNIDEMMQKHLNSYLQEYLYAQYLSQAKREGGCGSPDLGGFLKKEGVSSINLLAKISFDSNTK